MKKVLLINTNTEKIPYPIPPVGLCLLASFIEPFYEVRIFDGMFRGDSALENTIKTFSPDYIGFSIRNVDDVVPEKGVFYIPPVHEEFIMAVREITTAPLILGGSGFSMFPEEIMKFTGADYGVAGEGETVFLDLLNRLDHNISPEGLPNVFGKMFVSGRSYGKVLDYRNSPLSEIDRRLDFRPYTERGVYSIQTKRGCALGCIYCSYPSLEGKQYRLRDPAGIAREIAEASERLGPGVTFEFVDSTFNEPAGHAEGICRELIRQKVKVRLRTMGVNPRRTNRELFSLMIEAGFAQIDVTPDSASPAIIRNLRKGFTLEDIVRTAKLIREYKLPSMWFFLFGGPGETHETFQETLDFIDEWVNNEDMVYMSAGLRVYPYTPLHGIAVSEKKIAAGQSLFHPSVYYFSETASRKELTEWISEACKSRNNCLPPYESSPPSEMLKEAIALRSSLNLSEPMFRTLLRLRQEWMKQGKL